MEKQQNEYTVSVKEGDEYVDIFSTHNYYDAWFGAEALIRLGLKAVMLEAVSGKVYPRDKLLQRT